MSRAASFFTEALAWSASAVLRGLEPLRPGAVVEGVAGHEDLGGPVEHADVAEGVTGGRDHLQPEDLGAVGRGDDRAWAGDLGDVGRTRVHGGLGGPGRHVREAPRVVAVVVRKDEVGHGLPARPGGLQGRPDGVRAAGHPGVHDRGLPATDQDVRGHEAEVGAGPGQLSGRGGAGGGPLVSEPAVVASDGVEVCRGVEGLGLEQPPSTATATPPQPRSTSSSRRVSRCRWGGRVEPKTASIPTC